jgi:thioredoxin 1
MKNLTVRMVCPAAALVLLLALMTAVAPAAGLVVNGNQGREGETLDLNRLADRGKFTLVDFWSPYCPPCLKLAPVLEKMAARRPDLKVVKLNINRPGVQGIDFKSPLARQYNLRFVPFFVIFDQNGKVMAEGEKALDVLEQWAKQAGL